MSEVRKKELQRLIDMLQWDINMFWETQEDLRRLEAYKNELIEIDINSK